MTSPPLIIITGPTGAGKSDLALELAATMGGQIINADSLALYRGFNVGTAKPSPSDLAKVPHHLIDVLNPDEDFDAATFLRAARPIVENLAAQKIPAFAVGGTGFYLRSLTKGLFNGPGRDDEFRSQLALEAPTAAELHARLASQDPAAAERIAPTDKVRLERALEVWHLSGRSIIKWQEEHALSERPFRTISFVIDRPLAEMEIRLKKRTQAMFEAGLVAEVEELLAAGWPRKAKPFGSIGYREVLSHLGGELTLEETIEKTFISTRRYAKRQRTWFRGQMPEALPFYPWQQAEILELCLKFM